MKPGDKVRCIASRGYAFTTGKVYEVVLGEPPWPDQWYTWPAYLHVVDDFGKQVCCHASRFVKVEG